MSRGEADETPDTPRYVITGGGAPTPEQLAALAVAMTPVVVEEDETAPAGPPGGNWRAAGIREAVGHRTFVALPDLQAGRFPLG